MNKVLSILSVLVLMGGVIVSVRLVDMNQDFRSRASVEDGIVLCHKTGSETNPGNTISVNENAVQAHLDHGDSFGECESNDQSDSPDQENEVANGEENIESAENNNVADSDDNQNSNSEGEQDQTDNTQNDDNQNNNNSGNKNEKNIVENIIDAVTGNNNQNNDSNSNSDQNNSDSDVDPSPTIQPISTKPTDPQNKFIFTLRPSDLNRGIHPIPVSFTFYQNGNSIYKIKSVAYHVSNGLFRGEFEGVSSGSYQVYLKTNSHLGKLFSNVQVIKGNTNWDFSDSRLIVGDFNNDNNFNIFDIGEFLSEYNSTKVTAVSSNEIYDLNHDGFIDTSDLDILLANYNQFNLKGDNF